MPQLASFRRKGRTWRWFTKWKCAELDFEPVVSSRAMILRPAAALLGLVGYAWASKNALPLSISLETSWERPPLALEILCVRMGSSLCCNTFFADRSQGDAVR